MSEEHVPQVGVEPNGNGGDSSAAIEPAVHQRLRVVTGAFNHREIAELTGVSLETARRYADGRGIGVSYIKRLCEALGVSADWLLLGRGTPVYRPGVPVDQMDTSVDEVLEGLSRYLKRLHIELARAGTGLHRGPGSPEPPAAAPTIGPAESPPTRPEEFVDPFAASGGIRVRSPSRAPTPPPVLVRLVLGPANGRQIMLPGGTQGEIAVRIDANGDAQQCAPGAVDPDAHLYRRVFDRVYRWTGPAHRD